MNWIPATDRRITTSGRHAIKKNTDRTNSTTPCSFPEKVVYDWPGVRVCFSVKSCQSVRIDLDGGNNYFDVIVNNKQISSFRSRRGRHTYTIYEIQPEQETYSSTETTITNFEIFKRTEAVIRSIFKKNHPVSFYSIGINSHATLLSPWTPFKSHRKIEFIGDSDICGFCALGKKTGTNHLPSLRGKSHHAGASFAMRTAEAFSAEAHLVSWSGKGVHSNAWNPTDDGRTMTHLWHRRVSFEEDDDNVDNDGDDHIVSAVDEWMPDLVVVKLGGNDIMNAASTKEDFAGALVRLMRDIRDKRPKATVLCITTVAPCLTSCDLKNGRRRSFVETTLKSYYDEAFRLIDDDKIFYRQIRPEQPFVDEDYAGMMHWSVSGHRKFAMALSETVVEIMKWDMTYDNDVQG